MTTATTTGGGPEALEALEPLTTSALRWEGAGPRAQTPNQAGPPSCLAERPSVGEARNTVRATCELRENCLIRD